MVVNHFVGHPLYTGAPTSVLSVLDVILGLIGNTFNTALAEQILLQWIMAPTDPKGLLQAFLAQVPQLVTGPGWEQGIVTAILNAAIAVIP